MDYNVNRKSESKNKCMENIGLHQLLEWISIEGEKEGRKRGKD
jgi:hypothetical protein